MDIAAIQSAIMQDEANQSYTSQQIQPLFQVSPQAKILIVGQAPGQKAQDRQKLFADASGNRLRAWLGVDEELFYESGQIAILPMDFYFPGAGKSGDLPPRKGFAQKMASSAIRTNAGYSTNPFNRTLCDGKISRHQKKALP